MTGYAKGGQSRSRPSADLLPKKNLHPENVASAVATPSVGFRTYRLVSEEKRSFWRAFP
jgi:hypothetical protein